MKKTALLLVCVLILSVFLCACSNRKGDNDLSYIVTLSAESEDYHWSYETDEEGIVDISEQITYEEDGTVTYTYIIESVGEGETEVLFTLSDAENEVSRTLRYKVTVDSDYKITAVLLSEDEPVREAVNIETKSDAENLVREELSRENPENEGELIFKTQSNDDGTFNVRVYKMTAMSNGKTKCRYVRTYIVSPDGSVRAFEEKDIPDFTITLK